ncbi:hypothetical protein bt91E135_001410 (plasmid) [Borrelia turicatae 91E135]|nr:hypothetical protein bt91E135_001410 [Borrelia turicatae 91E135]
MNLVSILVLRLFSTVSILLSKSLISDFNSFLTLTILLSRSLISACKVASTFSSLRLKVVSKYSISL